MLKRILNKIVAKMAKEFISPNFVVDKAVKSLDWESLGQLGLKTSTLEIDMENFTRWSSKFAQTFSDKF